MDVVLYNSTVCRLCSEENENGVFLYSDNQNNQNISEVINTYLPLKVTDDGELPRTICPGCTIQLEATVEFLNLIVKGQKSLRQLYQREKDYKKNITDKPAEPEVITEKIVYEINTSDGIYHVEHPVSLQVSGLDKPKRKRGRPPKKPKSSEELALEAELRDQEEERKRASRQPEREGDGKRRRKTPERYKTAVQGKELERIFKEVGVIDEEDSDSEYTGAEPAEREPPAPPEVIGKAQGSGELVLLVKGKKGRPKGRMRPTLEKCAICGMEFTCVGRYMSHVARHGAVRYRCDSCGLEFDTRLLFTQHQEQEKHSGQTVIQQTKETNDEGAQATPVNDPTNNQLPPALSNDQTSTGAKLPSTVTSTDDIEKLLTTNEFLKGYSADSRSETESVNVETTSSPGVGADDIRPESPGEPPDDAEQSATATKRRLKCNLCDKTFSTKQSKSMHMKATHAGERPYVCKECGAAFPYPRSLSLHALSHRRTDSSKGFACDLCGKILNHPSSVVYHKEAEHAGQQFNCIHCGKLFKHKQLLRRHQLVHSQLRPFICKVCNASFKTKANMLNHQLLHTGVKRFVCEVCNQKFAHKTSLTLHMRLHTGIKPFSCGVCGKSFSQKGNLSEHERIHTGEKPYKCYLCPRIFTTSSQHRLHLRRHNAIKPYACTHCPKRFLCRDTWKTHMRREAGRRDHRCDVCPRTFCDKLALSKHRRCHTGERPYTCPACPRTFADHSNLNKHKKQVHKQQVSLLTNRARNQPLQLVPDPQGVDEADPALEERVIYVSYDVEDGAPTIELRPSEVAELPDCDLYSGESLLVDPGDLATEDALPELVEDQGQQAEDAQMAVTDEDGNPLLFRMQDGTQLAITSIDGKTLQVVTHDGQTIPVEIKGYDNLEDEEEEEAPATPQEPSSPGADGGVPVAHYFTIV